MCEHEIIDHLVNRIVALEMILAEYEREPEPLTGDDIYQQLKARDEKIVRLRSEGLTIRQIARETDLPKDLVSVILKNNL